MPLYKFSVPELPLNTQALVSISPSDLVLFFNISLPEWGFSSGQQIASQPTGPLSLSLDSSQYIWVWVFPCVSLEKRLSIFILHMTASVCLIWLPSLINRFCYQCLFFPPAPYPAAVIFKVPLTPWHPKDKARACQVHISHRLLKQNRGLCSGEDNSHSFHILWKPWSPFLLATSHRFDKLSHWITYKFFFFLKSLSVFCVLLLQSKSPSYEGEPANPLALKSLLSYHKQNRRETTSFAFVVAQAGLEFLFYCFIQSLTMQHGMVRHSHQSPNCWGCRSVLPHLTFKGCNAL